MLPETLLDFCTPGEDISVIMASWLGAGSERSHFQSSGCLIQAGFTAATYRLKLKKTRQWPAGVCEFVCMWFTSISLWVSVLEWILVRCSLKGTSCFFLQSPWITSTFPPWSSLVTQDSFSMGTGFSFFFSLTVDKTGNFKGIVDNVENTDWIGESSNKYGIYCLTNVIEFAKFRMNTSKVGQCA